MGPTTSQKRKAVEDGIHGKVSRPKKRSRKQLEYHSSSSDGEGDDAGQPSFAGVNLQDSDSDNDDRLQNFEFSEKEAREWESKQEKEERSADGSDASSEQSDASGEDSDSSMGSSNAPSTTQRRKLSKRNDPTAFSTSISKILSTKLPTSARADPLLSRSKEAVKVTSELANEKLEARARAKLRAEKKEELERGRVKDVLGVERGEAGPVAEQEKKLRKIAQRGVVKLFNAVRAAQVRGEEVAREERQKRTIVGMGEREKLVNEVSKQSFLELINGKGKKALKIEEA
ncbi:hypothetical protein VTO42DRAFT_6390 [Malbranchea cinnamomea]